MRRFFGWTILVLSAFTALACSATQEVTLSVLRPPEAISPHHRTIAVWSIEPPHGADSQAQEGAVALANEIRGMLVQHGRFDHVLNRADLETLLLEQGISVRDITTDELRVQLGRLEVAEVLVTGRLSVYEGIDRLKYARGTAIVVEVSNNISAHVQAFIAATDVSTGAQLAAVAPRSQRQYIAFRPPPLLQELLAECRGDIVSDFQRKVAFWTETSPVKLYVGDGRYEFFRLLSVSEYLRGVEHAERGSWDRAAAIFAEGAARLEREGASKQLIARGHSNTAVAFHALGRCAEAAALYARATELEDDLDFEVARRRCLEDHRQATRFTP